MYKKLVSYLLFIILCSCRIGHDNFELVNHDIVNPLMIEGESEINYKSFSNPPLNHHLVTGSQLMKSTTWHLQLPP